MLVCPYSLISSLTSTGFYAKAAQTHRGYKQSIKRLTVKEWDDVVESTIIHIALELRQDNCVFLVVWCNFICKVNVDDVFNGSAKVREVFNVLSIFHYGRLSAQMSLESLHIRV